LNARGVKAVIIGGHAVAYHAKPRYTKDLDLLVEPSTENARRLLTALEDFGFGDVDLEPDDFTTAGRVVQLGVAPNRIDILNSIEGVTFEQVWAGRVPGRYGQSQVFYIGKPELILNKRAAGRPQDLADLDWLT